MALMVTISGVRGVVGSSLFPSVIEKYVASFAQLQKGSRIILGRDSRVSGGWINSLAEGILVALGYTVINIGLATTPTVQVIVQEEKADGAVIITSSHNPIEWNGLKFVDRDGLFLAPERCQKMFEIADSGSYLKAYPEWEKMGNVVNQTDSAERHLAKLWSLPYIDLEKIRQRSFVVALDTVNGAGGPIMMKLLEKAGCKVHGMNLEPNGKFAHKPEPIPENLGDLGNLVLSTKANFGVAVDPDVDRCVLINEKGQPLGEEYTLAFAVEFLLGKVGKRGNVCKNLSSSKASDDIAKSYGCTVHAAAVGEINVAVKMLEVNAVIGGEGNGGVMLPDVHIGRDAPVALVLILQLLASFQGTISDLKASLPQYEIVKLKAPIGSANPDVVVAEIQKQWTTQNNSQGNSSAHLDKLFSAPTKIDTQDGLHISGDDWWVHLRKSNTEPIIRVIAEAHDRATADLIAQAFLVRVEKALSK